LGTLTSTTISRWPPAPGCWCRSNIRRSPIRRSTSPAP
jgi:hypothetical protein